ncbi:MAG: zinc ribbon domain-containing protein [Muribaculaceae bacterium]|nr:zinc ribbon domain-containing protein [Muribaculaceae bacterium]
MADETKVCPYCGEDININAIKCKHCGEFLNGSTQSTKYMDSLDVDDSWKERFKLIEKYYIDGLCWKPTEDYKKLAPKEANNIFQNIVFKNGGIGTFISVTLFGIFYYFAKKMWIKGLAYILIALVIEFIIYLLFGLNIGDYRLNSGFCAGLAVIAPFDYYRYKVLGKQW